MMYVVVVGVGQVGFLFVVKLWNLGFEGEVILIGVEMVLFY